VLSLFYFFLIYKISVIFADMAKNEKKQIIIFDRVQVYRDFIINLIYYIFEYYIDDGSFDNEDIDKFYDWCFNKVCDEFKEEGVDFSKNIKIKKYFKEYFEINYFHADDEHKQERDFYITFWDNVFNANSIGDNKLLAAFVELYSFFDDSINERKKTKESCNN
jgi:hypothetical protein